MKIELGPVTITATAEYLLNSQGVRKDHGEKEVVWEMTHSGKKLSTFRGLREVSHLPNAVAMLGEVGLSAASYNKILDAFGGLINDVAKHNAECRAHSLELHKLGNGDINQFATA